MSPEEEKTLRKFETRVRQLIMKHQHLVQEIGELHTALDERDRTITELKERGSALAKKYADLKLAKMIDISSNEAETAQKRLTKLIREVDKCIALLNI